MSDNSIIVDKYAKAAFNIAKKAKISDVFVKDFGIFCNATSPFLKELANPAISNFEIKNIIADISKKLKINDKLEAFIITLAQSRRIKLIVKIQEKLEHLVKADNNILEVELVSAVKLKADQINQTKDLLKKKYPKKNIEIQANIDKDILGGVIIKIGSFVIDNSIKNQLESIYNECRLAI